MKKVLYIILVLFCVGCSHKGQSSTGAGVEDSVNFDNYPDTITVAFTRDGKFEDSVEAVREGLLEDKSGKYYSPAYVFRAVVGDTWVYDVNGKFVYSTCLAYPHSGKPHHYKP